MEPAFSVKGDRTMELAPYFKSVLDQDPDDIVICGLDHEILYMNPAALSDYQKYGGAALLGRSVLDCHNPKSWEHICQVLDWFARDPGHNSVFTYHSTRKNMDVYMVALRDEGGTLIGYYEKHTPRAPETGTPFSMD